MKKYKQFICLSGLPRSGSTLLTSILSQNPKIHSEGNSAVCQLMWDMLQSCNNGSKEQLSASKRESTIIDLISIIPEVYYNKIDVNEKIIVDKCRSWTLPDNIDLLKTYIDKDIKIIVLERPIIEIANSFMKLYQKNIQPIDMDKLLEPGTEPIMRSLQGVLLAKEYNKTYPNTFLFITYKNLTEKPKETMQQIYDFCGWDDFQHDFQNVVPKYKEHDDAYILKGLHDIDSVVKKNTSIIQLPESIIEKCVYLDNILEKS